MNRFGTILVGIALASASPARARGDLDSASLRSIHAKCGASIVRVETVVRKQLDNGVDLDVESQGIGVVVKPGMVMTVADSFKDAHTLGSRVFAIRVVVAGGATFDAALAGSDLSENLSFVTVSDPEFPGVPVELATDDSLRVGDFFATLRLAGPSFQNAPYLDAFLVSATLAEPRCAITTYAISDYLGSIVAAADGRVVGFVNRISMFGRAARVDPVTGQRELELFADIQGYDGDGEEIVVVPASRYAALIADPPVGSPIVVKERAWLGCEVQPLLPELASALEIAPERTGVLVTRVLPGSPAADAGVSNGDLVYAVGGVPLEVEKEGDEAKLSAILARHAPGDSLALSIERAGSTLELTAILAAAPEPATAAAKHECPDFGFAVRDLVYSDRADLDLPLDGGGARATLVKRTGFAGLGGLRVGDVVRAVDDREITDATDLAARLAALAAARAERITLFIVRGADTLFVEMRPDWAAARPTEGR